VGRRQYLREGAELGGRALERGLLRLLVIPQSVKADRFPELRRGLNFGLGFDVVLGKRIALELARFRLNTEMQDAEDLDVLKCSPKVSKV
jgi:hypothetical protein